MSTHSVKDEDSQSAKPQQKEEWREKNNGSSEKFTF